MTIEELQATGWIVFDPLTCQETARAALELINGKLGNMNLTEATQLMTEMRPRLAVPAHYGMFAENTADHAEFVVACVRLGQPAFALPFGRAVDCAALLKNSGRAPSHEGKP